MKAIWGQCIMPGNEKRLTLSAPGKINLFFELLGKRDDGFHEVETVMSAVSIYDHLEFQVTREPDICLEMANEAPGIPTDERNLIVMAINRMRQLAAEQGSDHLPGIRIRLLKKIPAAAGMGGASSDAASAIMAANELWGLNWSLKKQCELASTIGSDVPFFLNSHLAICTGRGEKIKPIAANFRMPVVIARPPQGLSTADVYARCVVPDSPRSSEELLKAFSLGRTDKIGGLIFNRLEPFAGELSEWTDRLRYEFDRTNCAGHQLTGSGSCYFGIYPNRKVAINASRCLSNRLPDVTILNGETLNCGGDQFSDRN